MKPLTKDEMKNLIGGVLQNSGCIFFNNPDNGCGGGSTFVPCNGSSADCQSAGDQICAASNCCDDVVCGSTN